MPTFRANGIRLYYELHGRSGEPLVFVHGSWSDHRTFDLVVPHLKGYRVLTYDRRGHSQSEHPEGPGRIEHDVDDLAALIEGLDLAPAHLVGGSYGSLVVLRLALRRPELVRTALAHEPLLFGLIPDDPFVVEVRAQLAKVAASIARGEIETAARAFLTITGFGHTAWDQLPPHIRQVFLDNAPTWLDEIAEPEAYTIDLAALRALGRPLVVTRGKHSPAVYTHLVDRLTAAEIPALVHRVIPGGHIPVVTHPEEFAAIVREHAVLN